jgi:hypothetical protein
MTLASTNSMTATDLEQALTEARNTLTADRLDMSFGELINMYDSGELRKL